jgi:tetratricopeptide (TPR) repeat protein
MLICSLLDKPKLASVKATFFLANPLKMINFATSKNTHTDTMAENDNTQSSSNIDLGQTVSKAEGYLQENKKSLTIILSAILVVVLGYFGYQKFIVEPQQRDAIREMFVAENYFKTDSLDKALNGDGQYMGFLEIIDTYGSSKAANNAKYYAGVCYLRKGDFNKAIEFLSDFDAEDDVLGAVAYGAIGDANLELKNNDEALKHYRMAVDYDNNMFSAPYFLMKVAFVQELNKDYKGALETYERIKKDFPKSTEAREIERYIARASNLSKAG